MSAVVSKIQGPGIPLVLDDIDTDRIIPARYLRCVTFDGLGEFAFEDDRRQDPRHPFNQERFHGARILVVGRNFGCGSSREHAPQAIKRFGIQAVIAESFAEIFSGNCKAIGVPVIQITEEAMSKLNAQLNQNPQTQMIIDLATQHIRFYEESLIMHIPDAHRNAFLNGTWDILSILKANKDAIQTTYNQLPYCQFKS